MFENKYQKNSQILQNPSLPLQIPQPRGPMGVGQMTRVHPGEGGGVSLKFPFDQYIKEKELNIFLV